MNRTELANFTQWAWDQYESSGDLSDLATVVSENPELLQPRRITESLLFLAVSAGDLPSIDLLLQLGVPTAAPSGNDSEYVSTAIFRRELPLVEKTLPWCTDFDQSDDGYHPLLAAIDADMLEAVQPLVDAGASLTTTGINGNTPLHLAASMGNRDAVSLLAPFYEDVDIRDSDYSHWTPLMTAAFAGATEAVRVLLANGADVTLRDSAGHTAVQLAQENSHEAIVVVLLNSSPPV